MCSGRLAVYHYCHNHDDQNCGQKDWGRKTLVITSLEMRTNIIFLSFIFLSCLSAKSPYSTIWKISLRPVKYISVYFDISSATLGSIFGSGLPDLYSSICFSNSAKLFTCVSMTTVLKSPAMSVMMRVFGSSPNPFLHNLA